MYLCKLSNNFCVCIWLLKYSMMMQPRVRYTNFFIYFKCVVNTLHGLCRNKHAHVGHVLHLLILTVSTRINPTPCAGSETNLGLGPSKRLSSGLDTAQYKMWLDGTLSEIFMHILSHPLIKR